MGKPTICIGENKGADQLCDNREADKRLCLRYSDSTIPPLQVFLQNFKLLACFCSCTGRFVSDLFGNHIVCFPTRRPPDIEGEGVIPLLYVEYVFADI